MAGTWTEQNKILPGAYINFRTNVPLSITRSNSGIVVLLQEMSVGEVGDIYTVTSTANNYPEGITYEYRLLVIEALKCAKTVLVYNLGLDHDAIALSAALDILKTTIFDVLAYPYDSSVNNETIKSWITTMRDIEGVRVVAVLANYVADYEGIINVAQGIKLENGTVLTPEQVTAWVAGQTAGASINQSNTGRKYVEAIDVVPRMTKTEMEAAILAGKFIFKVDSAQNVTALYDINSLTTKLPDKGKQFTKNRVIRTLDSINNDITEIFESNYVGRINNNADGRSLLRATLIEYFNELQRQSAIINFAAEDVSVTAGTELDAVVIDCFIQPVDSVEKIYITVSLT